MKKLVLLLVAGLMVSAFIIGCSTEDPWSPEQDTDLALSIVSGPDEVEVPYGASITYAWTSHGGVGEVEYAYRLGGGDFSAYSNMTSVQFENIMADATFEVQARDDVGTVGPLSASFTVGEAGSADTTPPTVGITASPAEGSYVATGSSVSFSWGGSDDVDMDNLLYQYSFAGYTSEMTPATTATFADVEAADPAEFMVTCYDQSDNASSAASVSFIIHDATILYVDDFLWVDANGNPDMVKERDQKQFYRDALSGFAISEWDVSIQGLPDSATFVTGGVPNFSTVLFASDSDVGSDDGSWWTLIGVTDNDNALNFYMESGGNLIATGPLIMPNIWYNSNPPQVGDFEYNYLGVSDEPSGLIDAITTTWWLDEEPYDEPILFPDSVVIDTTYFDSAWDYEWWFTWAIKDAGTTLNLPDSMKLDVAKNGDQDDYACAILSLRNDSEMQTEVLFNWGLWVDGGPPAAPYYMNPVGYICRLSATDQWTAVMHFDTYAMPLPAMRQTFRAILEQFGE